MRAARRRLLAAAALAGGASTSLGQHLASAALPAADRPLRVVVSFSILADLVHNVAGPLANVDSLVGPDSDAHVLEPTPLQAQRLAEADLVIVNGLGFEGWLPRLIAASGYRGPVALASDGIAVLRIAGVADPHVWQSLANGAQMTRNIERALASARPAAGEALLRRGDAYRALLAELDRGIRSRFDPIPRQLRRVVTMHDAFAYFGAAYGIDFFAPLGAGTQNEPSAGTLARLSVQIQKQAIRAVFVENIADPRLVQHLAEESGATVGGKLYSDALSAPGGTAETYLKLVAHNATTIAAALNGRKVGRLHQGVPSEAQAFQV